MRRATTIFCCLAATVLVGAGGTAGAGASSATASMREAATAIRQCADRHRRAAGLDPLQPSGVLAAAARLQARNMARHRFFDHTDHLERGPLERVEIFDSGDRFDLVGENIAAGYPSVAVTCAAWMRSAGHRANILRATYKSIGAGFARGGEYGRHYVQVFGA
jgi:streptogrisin C